MSRGLSSKDQIQVISNSLVVLLVNWMDLFNLMLVTPISRPWCNLGPVKKLTPKTLITQQHSVSRSLIVSFWSFFVLCLGMVVSVARQLENSVVETSSSDFPIAFASDNVNSVELFFLTAFSLLLDHQHVDCCLRLVRKVALSAVMTRYGCDTLNTVFQLQCKPSVFVSQPSHPVGVYLASCGAELT